MKDPDTIFNEINVDYPEIPNNTIREIMRYHAGTREGFGHFMTAVINNDLKEAAVRADSENRAALGYIAMLVHFEFEGYFFDEEETNESILPNDA